MATKFPIIDGSGFINLAIYRMKEVIKKYEQIERITKLEKEVELLKEKIKGE